VPTRAARKRQRCRSPRQRWSSGQRGGKSRILALIAVYLACFRDYAPYLTPGEVATIAVIASDRKQARSILRFTIGLLRAVPMLAAMIEDDGAEAIVLDNRVVIEIHTASFRVTRGYRFAAVLADETAFWRDENSANPDVEIIPVLDAVRERKSPVSPDFVVAEFSGLMKSYGISRATSDRWGGGCIWVGGGCVWVGKGLP
jgi:hypothetical protein